MKKLILLAFLFISVGSNAYNWVLICESICKEQKTLLHKSEYYIADGYEKNRKQLSSYYDNASCEGDTLYFLEIFKWGRNLHVSTFWIKTDTFPQRGFLSYTGYPDIREIWNFQAEKVPFPLMQIKLCNDWDLETLGRAEGDDYASTKESHEILTRVILYKKNKYKVDCFAIKKENYAY